MLWALVFTVSGEHAKTLWVTTVWQTSTSVVPEEDDATSHMHLTLNNIVGDYHHLVLVGMGNKA